MAWTAPRTYVTSEIITASILNTDLRDNLLETAPAVATAGGRLIVTTGANAVIERLPTSSTVNTSESTSSTSYTDLATSGPAVTTTTSDRALIVITSRCSNNTTSQNSHASYAVSGATTISANDNFSLAFTSSAANEIVQASFAWIDTNLNAGSNTFTMKYRAGANTATFSRRTLSVIPF